MDNAMNEMFEFTTYNIELSQCHLGFFMRLLWKRKTVLTCYVQILKTVTIIM